MEIAERTATLPAAITPANIQQALIHHRQVMYKTTAAFLVAGIVLCFALPNFYSARTTLMPPNQPGSSTSALAALGGSGALSSSLGIKNQADFYVGLLRSRNVSDFVIKNCNLEAVYHLKYYSDVATKLESNVLIEADPRSGLIALTATDRDPARAAEIANSFVAGYDRISSGLAITEASRRRRFFEKQLEQAKDNLATAEQDLTKLQATAGIIEPSFQTQALIESGAALRAQVAAKKVQIETMQGFATDQNPQMEQALHELEALQGQLATLESSSAGGGKSLVPSRGEVQGVSLEYTRRLRDVKYYETIFDLLARQFEAAKLDEARQGAELQVVDTAIRPDRKSGPKRSLILFLSVAVGIMVGGIWILLIMFKGATKHSAPLTDLAEAERPQP